MLWIGILMVTGGLLTQRWVGKRQFERRNASGVQEFRSYDAAVGAQATEKLALVLARLGIFLGLIIVGCVWLVSRM